MMAMSSTTDNQPALFWIDLEMTGLDAAVDRILECAVIVTDHDFNELEHWDSAVYQSAAVLEGMNEWCQTHHRDSGLLDRVPEGIEEAELDRLLSAKVDVRWGHTPVILCGNSIHQDRKFIDRYLPSFARRLHYRMLDVSAWKVAFIELYGLRFDKHNTHRALDDIRESIAEFRYYLGHVKV